MIWKPSSNAALTAIATMKIIWPVLKHNGLPDGILNLVIGGRKTVGEKLIHIGHPLDEGVHMGPLIDSQAVRKMRTALQKLREQGGRISDEREQRHDYSLL